MTLKKFSKLQLLLVLLISLLPVLVMGQVGNQNPSPKDADTYYDAATQKILGNNDEAIKLFKKCLDQDPSDAAAMYEIADIYVKQKDPDKALPFAEKAVSTDPSNKWYKILLMDIYQSQSQYEKAGKIIKDLLVQEPENLSFIEDLALNYLYQNDYKNALKAYDTLEEKTGLMEEISIQKEKIYLIMGKTDKAIAEIQKLSDSDPSNPRYLEMMAELYMGAKDYDKALAMYKKVLEVDPNNPYINISLADYYHKQGDKEKSFEYLKKGFANPKLDIDTEVQILLAYYTANEIFNELKPQAFELSEILVKAHPDEPKAWSIYADLLYQDKQFGKARENLLKVISMDSSRYLVWEELLFCESQLSDFKAMASEGRRAVALFPQQPLPYLFTGVADFQMKNYKDAEKYFKDGAGFVVSNDKLLSQFYSYLGDTYYQLDDNDASDSAYEKVLKIDPNNSLVLNNYAYYLSLRGKDLTKAEDMAKKAVDLDPGNASNQDTYGWILYKTGSYDAAKDWIGKAIKSGEESAVVLEHYGDVLYKLGDKKEALKYWEKAQKAGQGSEFLQKKVQDKTLYE